MGLFSKKKPPQNIIPHFNQPSNTVTITCRHIIKEGKPILRVHHDAEDGTWQFLCGGIHTSQDAMIVGLGEIISRDQTLFRVVTLPPGQTIVRDTLESEWQLATD